MPTMDELEELLSAVHHLAWPGKGELVCDEPGHPAGHRCLPPVDRIDLSALQGALSERYGRMRNLAMERRAGTIDCASVR
jgi:hypothetical protein